VSPVSVSRPRGVRRMLLAGLALVAAGAMLSACSGVSSNLVEYQPYKVEPIKGTDLNRVTLDDKTAGRIDLQTSSVRRERGRKVVPHAALIYNPEGDVFVYTRPQPQTYVRAPVKVSRVAGDRAVLSQGPPSGTVVVTVGAAELLATEYEILNQHP
jgi:hypothetical protein